MNDGSVMFIISSEGCQQGDPVAQFVFVLAEGPVLMAILSRIRHLDNRYGLFAIHDDITSVVNTSVASEVYAIVAQKLSSISILGVPTKSHLNTTASNLEQVSSSLHSDIHVHHDGLEFLGTAVGSEDFRELS